MADKTLKDVVDSLKAVDNTIKKQPKPKDMSKPLKDVKDSMNIVHLLIQKSLHILTCNDSPVS